MRVLTVRQPWAWAIIHGGKDVENRVRNIAGDYRGPVAIHVAKGLGSYNDTEAALQAVHVTTAQDVRAMVAGGPRHGGHLIGVVDLVDVHSASVMGGCGRMDYECVKHPAGCRRHCSSWAMGPAPEGWYQHLVFANPRALDQPIPWKGALGLRKTNLDIIGEHLVERVETCTCGQAGVSGPHEPACGYEMVARLVATEGQR